jgi:hypothetical protein
MAIGVDTAVSVGAAAAALLQPTNPTNNNTASGMKVFRFIVFISILSCNL